MSQINIQLSEKDIERFWSKVDKKSEDECWEWKACKSIDGYGTICIKSKMYKAHRVSWFLHNGEIPENNSYHGLCVLHVCDNPGCVNHSHLFLGTNKDNMLDMIKKERNAQPQGEKHGRHKLTEQQVIEIRKKYVPHVHTQAMLAEEYCVSCTTIRYVVRFITWKHVEE